MSEEFYKAAEALDQAKSILMTTHERTDGDDFGTILALAHHVERQGKRVTLAVKGGVPSQLRFLPGSERVMDDIPSQDFDLVVISGCSNRERVGFEKLAEMSATVVNIDHHPDNAFYGHINVVDPAKSAVAELAYDMFQTCKWQVTPEIATCLLTGIFTDTGSFMHSNTQASTLKASSELMRKGAPIARIARHTYQGKGILMLKAWGKAFANTQLNKMNGLIYSVMSDQDLQEVGGAHPGAFEGFVETLNKVPEAKFALFLKQDGDIVKGSLRSDPHKGINVGKIAEALGGGGHKWAAGFSLPGKLMRDAKGAWKILTKQKDSE